MRRGGGKGGGVGKIVKYGGMSNDCSSDKKSHKVRFEQALFKQIGPQLLYGLPVRKPAHKDRMFFPNLSVDLWRYPLASVFPARLVLQDPEEGPGAVFLCFHWLHRHGDTRHFDRSHWGFHR